ncbi:MAG: hypothetical protein Q3979_04835 [Actinomycetaceae bacterium]|nr:hypothetical protein [Actinomycetaceae bacterium]
MAREVEFLAGERQSGLAAVLDVLPERAHQGKDVAGMDALADLCRKRVGLAGGGPVHDIGNLLAQFGVLVFSLTLASSRQTRVPFFSTGVP